MIVNAGRISSKHSTNNEVGMGSREKLFLLDYEMTFFTSSSLTKRKDVNVEFEHAVFA